uniref:Uncharacterized protein n=1 Tax=Ciona intestinalis TaxID=7719 RepID=F6SRG5_CIOIN
FLPILFKPFTLINSQFSQYVPCITTGNSAGLVIGLNDRFSIFTVCPCAALIFQPTPSSNFNSNRFLSFDSTIFSIYNSFTPGNWS